MLPEEISSCQIIWKKVVNVLVRKTNDIFKQNIHEQEHTKMHIKGNSFANRKISPENNNANRPQVRLDRLLQKTLILLSGMSDINDFV